MMRIDIMTRVRTEIELVLGPESRIGAILMIEVESLVGVCIIDTNIELLLAH